MDLRKTGPQTRGLSRLPNSHVFARHLLKFNEQAEKKTSHNRWNGVEYRLAHTGMATAEPRCSETSATSFHYAIEIQ